jgi:hypothetical protein
MRMSLTAILAAFVLAFPAYAQRGRSGGGGHSSGRSSSGSVHVRGYSSRSGKSVQPYKRNAPGEGRSKASAPHASKSTRSPRASAPHITSPRSPAASHPRATTPATPGARDSHGRLKRSEKAKEDFLRQTGHPHGWPGHVVDHKMALACGGADVPSNMQWQTIEEAKAKDKVERQGCTSRH